MRSMETARRGNPYTWPGLSGPVNENPAFAGFSFLYFPIAEDTSVEIPFRFHSLALVEAMKLQADQTGE